MADARRPSGHESGERSSSALGCLIEMFWRVGGIGLLTALAVLVLREPAWTLTWKDAAFWTAVAAVVAARAIDARRTVDGERTASRDVRRFAGGVLVLAAIVWVAVQSTQLGPRI